MKKILIGLTTLAALGAQASTVSYSHATNAANAGFTDNFTLAAFDTTLGTLTGITLDVSNEITAQITISNSAPVVVVFIAVFAGVLGDVTGPAGLNRPLAVEAILQSGSAHPGLNRYPEVVGSVADTFVLDPAYFAAYESSLATSSLNFRMRVGSVEVTAIGLRQLVYGGTAEVSGRTTITYTYDEATPSANVPEPGTLALAGVALAGLLASRRVRHAGLPA